MFNLIGACINNITALKKNQKLINDLVCIEGCCLNHCDQPELLALNCNLANRILRNYTEDCRCRNEKLKVSFLKNKINLILSICEKYLERVFIHRRNYKYEYWTHYKCLGLNSNTTIELETTESTTTTMVNNRIYLMVILGLCCFALCFQIVTLSLYYNTRSYQPNNNMDLA
ncbi:hypothetical protein TCON_2582 [Astathelohania contejeani]|uniref:Uncharacterized protein n=1 Tax=Astathelohania contejeani TaxID=164912 RepID=A0ABQ7HVL5_9MICR|nr:hypothetical protein TCON_2582 [Thelohania contejeani]